MLQNDYKNIYKKVTNLFGNKTFLVTFVVQLQM